MKPVVAGPDLWCPNCGDDLPEDALTRVCACGRPVETDEIAAMEAVLRNWEAQLAALRDLSADPRLEGFESIRESFHHRIRRLVARIELLRNPARN